MRLTHQYQIGVKLIAVHKQAGTIAQDYYYPADLLLPISHCQYFLMLRLSIKLIDQYYQMSNLLPQERLHNIIIIRPTAQIMDTKLVAILINGNDFIILLLSD